MPAKLLSDIPRPQI